MTPEEKSQLFAMRKAGSSYTEIADALGISKNTVKTFCRRNGLTPEVESKTTYWHFGSAKKPNFRTKKAPYIGICQFKVLLLSGTPRVRIAPGTPKSLKTLSFWAFFFCHYSSLVVFHFSAHISRECISCFDMHHRSSFAEKEYNDATTDKRKEAAFRKMMAIDQQRRATERQAERMKYIIDNGGR